MHAFLINNRDELLARCKAKVSKRPRRAASPEQLTNGIPLFIGQLIRTLEAEVGGRRRESLEISGASGGDVGAMSEIGVTATAHGKELLELGYSVDQVVHDYGDLCQSITDLAVETDAPFAVDQFRTLNRCLDNAIADAVLAFSTQRDAGFLARQRTESDQPVGNLVNDLRKSIVTATSVLCALSEGTLSISGATAEVLEHFLVELGILIKGVTAAVDSAVVDGSPALFALGSTNGHMGTTNAK